MNPIFILWQGGSGGAEQPEPEIMAALSDISQAFASDHGPMKLLPHERAQLKRIRALHQHDRRSTAAHLRIFKRRALEARKNMRAGRPSA